MIFVLLGAGINGLKFGLLWILFKKHRRAPLLLYMFAAASRTLLGNMGADDIQMIAGLKTLKHELEGPFYRHMIKNNLNFNSSFDAAAIAAESKLAPSTPPPRCQWIHEVEDRKAGDPVVYFLHGGGYALGMTFAQIYWMRDFVKALPQHRISVLALDYSLCPYAAYPTQLNEALYGYESLAKSCNKIITIGDSAGGALSAALAMKLKHHPDLHKKLFAQIYVSPWAELLPRMDGSVINNENSDWVCSYFAARCAGWYVKRDVDEEKGVFTTAVTDPCEDIGVATSEDLRSALPKNTACVWSTGELLADAVDRFVEKAGITDYYSETGTVHDVLYFGHNNDSSRFIIGMVNKWLSAPTPATTGAHTPAVAGVENEIKADTVPNTVPAAVKPATPSVKSEISEKAADIQEEAAEVVAKAEKLHHQPKGPKGKKN